MPGIKDRVAIVGMGCTKFGENWECSAEDMLVNAASEAFEDAGIEPDEVKAAWLGTTCSGRGGSTLAHALKLEYIPITRVENHCATGSDALRNAAYAVAAGIYDVVLAIGVEKLKDQGFSGLQGAPEIAGSEVRPLMIPPLQFALLATRYFHHYGLTFEEGKNILARIAVKNHYNGSLNPKAHLRREITVQQALNAPMIAWPLGLFDCCGVSDGAAAAILTRADLAPRFRDDYVLVKALGLVCGGFQGQLQSTYDCCHVTETVKTARLAYDEAGIRDPRREIDLAEVHDCFTITEALDCEDIGLADKGHYSDEQAKGTFELTGQIPVNPDGGLKSFGHPIGATGLRMTYEIYKQLQGKAGPRQIKKADIGLTHNLGGLLGRFACAVSIFGRRD